MVNLEFNPISPDTAIDLYTNLIAARRLQLQPALGEAVSHIGIITLDAELQRLVPLTALNHLAKLGLRGERVFPIPALIKYSPPLIGYYRMLLGLSKKEFERLKYQQWVKAETSAQLNSLLQNNLEQFCTSLIMPLAELITVMDNFNERDLSDLTLLTLGPTLQGGRNNIIGAKAENGIFKSIRSLVDKWITYDGDRLILFETPGGRKFQLVLASDPEICLNIGTGSQSSPVLAIEIKGGNDASNAHNRAGEAEKSHIKAKMEGYIYCWTIIVIGKINREDLRAETPSTMQLFEAKEILQKSGDDWLALSQQFLAVIGEVWNLPV